MKKDKQKQKNVEKNIKNKGFAWFLGCSALSVTLLFVCQFFWGNAITGNEKFFENTKINGIDVGNMTVAEAENVVLTKMLEDKKDIEIKLTYKDKDWVLNGNEFEVYNKIQPAISQMSKYGRDGNFIQKYQKSKEIKENGKDFQVSYSNILANLNEKIDEVIADVEQESKPASLIFQPNKEDVFDVCEGQNAVYVDRDKLLNEIDSKLLTSKQIEVEIPTIEIEEVVDIEAIKNSVGKRSEFSTSYEKSSSARKNNIKLALQAFNGLIVEPGQVVSFNETTGRRTENTGYKNAHIIVGGVYVDGVGGGVCQASTTLYNALLLADIDILTVNHHTLPASYVPLSFDAMVSGDYSDLVFQNNFDSPIYIKTSADDKNIKVEIYGQKIPDGEEIKTRSELVKILPHNGDKIVSDKKGDYASKVLYKGEYYRLKYPREGYESKAYVQYYKDGKLEREKEIRHDFYLAQDGVVIEGVEDTVEGMSIPASDVKIISPQKVSAENEERVRQKLTKYSPSEYNP